MDTEEIRKYIDKELKQFKIKQYSKGYKYLAETIYICIVNEDAIENMKQNVYPKVAKQFKVKNIKRVKWTLENAINIIYRDTEINTLCKYFDIEIDQKLSVKFFVYTIVSKFINSKQQHTTF